MNEKEEQELNRLKQTVEALGEHFDTVQIFATRHEEGGEGGTVNLNYGAGNWFARYGQIETWVTKAKERSRKEVHDE